MILYSKKWIFFSISLLLICLFCSFISYLDSNKRYEFFGVAFGTENVPSTNAMFEKQFLNILNKARKDSLLEPVMIDKDLSRAARYHSYDQATQNYIGHDTYDRNPETDSLEFVCDVHARTEKFLIYESKDKVWRVSGGVYENCAYGPSTAMKAFISWFNSPGHCKNMFNPDHRLVGIGYIHIPGSVNPHCWTTDFSR